MNLFSKVEGCGEPVILIHGLFGSAGNLSKLSRALSEHYEVHSIDARNHGRSPFSAEMNYALMADDVYTYIQNNKLIHPKLIGHSMGGKIVMEVAVAFTESVGCVIVADIAPVRYERHHNKIFEGLRSLDLKALSSRSDADQKLSLFVSEMPVRQFLLKSLYKNIDGEFDWRFNLNALFENYSNILAGVSTDKPCRKNILFIAGAASDYILPSHREKIKSMFPKAEFKKIVGATHWLHAEKPEIFNALCLGFFLSE